MRGLGTGLSCIYTHEFYFLSLNNILLFMLLPFPNFPPLPPSTQTPAPWAIPTPLSMSMGHACIYVLWLLSSLSCPLHPHDYSLTLNLYFFLKNFIFRERGREGERGGEKHQCVAASSTPVTGGLTQNPGMCPDWELNWRPFASQAGAQSTKPHQPGPNLYFFIRSLFPPLSRPCSHRVTTVPMDFNICR